MNEIIAFGSKYSLNNGIRVFVKSSKLYCDKLTIIVLNIEQNLRDFLEQENVNIIEGSELAQKYNINTNISPFTLKVIFYYLYIKHYTKSKNVFICDITDNYFKGNVFNLLSEDKSIFVASEDNKIKNCDVNGTWIRTCYGEYIYNQIRDKNIINSGTLLGTRDECIAFLDKVTKDCNQILSKISYPIIDQAVYNKIVHLNEHKVNIISDGIVNMSHLKDKTKIDTALVLHQYDIDEKLKQSIYSLFNNNKKIIVGINLFKPTIRQELCIQSLLKLKAKFNLTLVNMQYKDGTDLYTDDRIETVRCLTRKSKDYVGNRSKPIVKEFFEYLGSTDYDYFCFTNNDIIISDRLFDFVNKTDYETYSACRLAIHPINSLEDKIVPGPYQCVGFDTFIVQTKWWSKNKDKFLDFIAGHPCWDVDYAVIMRMHSNSYLVNQWPPSIFHIMHEAPWTTSEHDSAESHWNNHLHYVVHEKYKKIWHRYLYGLLFKRGSNLYTPLQNEKELEDQFFAVHDL